MTPDEDHTATANTDRVGVACCSCREGTTQEPCERPDGGWVYDSPYGWRCPSCAEMVLEALRAGVAQHERRIAAADRLVAAVEEHKRYWARVDWSSDRLERRIIDLLSEYQNGSQATEETR